MYLNTHTYYSLRYGTLKTEDLLELVRSNGSSTCVLTDINTTTACLDFVRLSRRYGIRPILGVDFREGVNQKYIAIAKNNSGFQAINEYLTEQLHKETSLNEQAPELDNTFIIYPFQKNKTYPLKSHEYIGVRPKDLDYIRLKKIDTSKCVILQPVTFRTKRDFNAHRLLRAIDNNTLLSKLEK